MTDVNEFRGPDVAGQRGAHARGRWNVKRLSELEAFLLNLVLLYSYNGHDVTCARIPGNGGRGKRSKCDCHLGEQLRAALRGEVLR